MDSYAWIKDFLRSVFTLGSEKHEIDLLCVKMKHLCRPLYKYCPVSSGSDLTDWSFRNFENDELFFRRPYEFNDPFDCFLGFTYNQTLIPILEEQLKRANIYTDKLYDAIKAFLNNDQQEDIIDTNEYNLVKQTYYSTSNIVSKRFKEFVANEISRYGLRITCFSEELLSPLMWSHYANGHFGFCMEYDFNSVVGDNFNLKIAQTMLFPVIYTPSRPPFPLELLSSKDNSDNSEFIIKMIYSLLHKSEEWSYEREWRIIKYTDDNPTLKLPPPKRVFLGINMDDRSKDKILELALRKKTEVYQMILSSNKYKFDYFKVL